MDTKCMHPVVHPCAEAQGCVYLTLPEYCQGGENNGEYTSKLHPRAYIIWLNHLKCIPQLLINLSVASLIRLQIVPHRPPAIKTLSNVTQHHLGDPEFHQRKS